MTDKRELELRDVATPADPPTSDEAFDTTFQQLAERLKTTAVFDGVGGELTSRIAPHLPADTTISLYGFVGGSAPISIPSALIMMKNLTVQQLQQRYGPRSQKTA